MISDIGFCTSDTKWTSRKLLKIIPYTDVRSDDVLVGITGSASQLTLVRAFLDDCTTLQKPIGANEAGIFEFAVRFNKFSQDLGVPTGVEVDGGFSTHHIVAHGRAWVVQGYFISEIFDWSAMGSGEYFAQAALTLGHDPVQAIRVACEHDLYCYGPPVSFRYNRAQHKIITQGDTLEKFHDDDRVV